MAVGQFIQRQVMDNRRIDRDAIVLPEFIFENYPSDLPRALKPVFDAIWNAAGWPRSLGYEDQGNWGKGPNFLR